MSRQLETVRKLIRQQTNTIDGVVTNIHGAPAGELDPLALPARQTWMQAVVPGNQLIALEEFYTVYVSQEIPDVEILPAIEGVVLAQEDRPVCMLLRTLATVPYLQSIPITVDVGSSAGEFAIYVDGKLERRGNSALTHTVTLDKGKHMIEVLAATHATVVHVPPAIPLDGTKDNPPVPVWDYARAGYIDPASGLSANELAWFVSPRVGGWRVLKREIEFTSEIVELTDLDPANRFAIQLDGDHTPIVQVGEQMNALQEHMGTVVAVYGVLGEVEDPENPGETIEDIVRTVVTLHLSSTRTSVNPGWLGATATVGAFIEAANIRRTQSTGTFVYFDADVKNGNAYEYALQSYGLFDPDSLSKLSEIRYVRAGDIFPPGPIEFITDDTVEPPLTYPRVFEGIAYVRYLTPEDEDYAGVHVYFRRLIACIVDTATESVLTFQGQPLLDRGVDATWSVKIVDDPTVLAEDDPELVDTAEGAVRPVSVATESSVEFALGDELPVAPAAGTLVHVYKDFPVVTDMGKPKKEDELQFDTKRFGEGDYIFRTFDLSNNEQEDDDAVFWYFDPEIHDGSAGGGVPMVSIRQLTPTEQFEHAPDLTGTGGHNYKDINRFAVLLIDGFFPPRTYDGVTLYYQTKAQANATPVVPHVAMPALTAPIILGSNPDPLVTSDDRTDNTFPVSADFTLDDPLGVRTRFVALEKTGNTNWIKVWASYNEIESGVMSYHVDYDSIPEIATIDLEVDNAAANAMGGEGVATIVVVGDDDTRSWEAWLTNPESNPENAYQDPYTTDAIPPMPVGVDGKFVPLAGPVDIMDDVLIRGSGRVYKIALSDGTYKAFHVRPWSGPNRTGTPGEVYTRVLARAPRTEIVFEERDPLNRISSSWVKARMSLHPPVTQLYPAVPDGMEEDDEPPTDTLGSGQFQLGGTSLTVPGNPGGWTSGYFNAIEQNCAFIEILMDRTTPEGKPVTHRVARQIIDTVVSGGDAVFYIDQSWPILPPEGPTGEVPAQPAVGDRWRIVNGAVWYRYATKKADLNVAAWNCLVPPYHVFFERTKEGRWFEYHAVLHGCPDEPVKRTKWDPDNLPSIESLFLNFNPDTQEIEITVDGLDDDVKYWRSYEKKGGWPTLDGDPMGFVDDKYLRVEEPASIRGYKHYASAGEYHVIVIPFSSYDDPGERKYGTVVATDEDTAKPTLTDFAVTDLDDPLDNYYSNKITFTHENIAEEDSQYGIRVWWWRADRGESTKVELGPDGTPRQVQKDVVWTNAGTPLPWSWSDDAVDPGQINVGSFDHKIDLPRLGPATGGAGDLTYMYEIKLYDGETFLSTYYCSRTDNYNGAPNADGIKVVPNSVSLGILFGKASYTAY